MSMEPPSCIVLCSFPGEHERRWEQRLLTYALGKRKGTDSTALPSER
jgi:hypothetical protein